MRRGARMQQGYVSRVRRGTCLDAAPVAQVKHAIALTKAVVALTKAAVGPQQMRARAR